MLARPAKFTKHCLTQRISGQLWKPLNKKVRSTCSFIRNKGYVNIWNGNKSQKNSYAAWTYFPSF